MWKNSRLDQSAEWVSYKYIYLDIVNNQCYITFTLKAYMKKGYT